MFSQAVPNQRASPVMISAAKAGDNYIKVVYGMPLKLDREIFGGLVPFGSVWRTGANEATEIIFTRDVNFGGADVPAGIYSLFTIPNETEWTVILNSELGQWGSFRYNQAADVARISVPVEKLDETWEAFRILLSADGDKVTLAMRWDKTGVTVPIRNK